MDKKDLHALLKHYLSKKYVANIIVLMAVAIMALILSGDFFFKESETKQLSGDPIKDVTIQEGGIKKTEEELIEERLKLILEKITGVGSVSVMVTFEIGPEIVPVSNTVESKNITEEKDGGGGRRINTAESITRNIVIAGETDGHKPLVLKEIKPQINGVIVVAEGAENIEVKSRLYEAVKTVLQIPAHKVQVYAKK